MSLAETSVLAVELKLNGVPGYTAGIAKAEAATATFGKSVSGGVSGGLAKAEKGLKSFGGALAGAGSKIGGLVTGPLGMIGLTAGILSLGGAIEQGISKAQSFGETVDRLMSVTGQSVETVSELVSAFDYFGVSADTTLKVLSMAEKNLGLLTSTTAKATDFAKTYGLTLVDSAGHVKDMNTLILDSADFFNNKLIPSSTKAAALSKIFGRNWQELVEVFEKGKPAIAAAEQQAKELGLTLSGQNLDDLLKYRDAQRELKTAMGGLELQIGLALIPAFTDLSKSVSGFVKDNRQGIVQFFKDAATNVGKFGDFLSKDVIPPLKTLGTAAANAWKAIPDPLKQILIGGIIANKAGKFLFDISIKDAAQGAIDLFGKLRGSSPFNPLFVQNVVPGGQVPPPGPTPTGDGGGIVNSIAGGAVVGLAINQGLDPNNATHQDFVGKFGYGLIKEIGIIHGAVNKAGVGIQAAGAAADGFARAVEDSSSALKSQAALLRDHSWVSNLAKGIEERSAKRFGHALGPAAQSATYQRDILGRARSIEKSGANSVTRLARMQQLLHDAKNATDATKKTLSGDIKALKAQVAKQKPPSVSVTVGTNVEVSANSVVATFKQTRSYGPSDPQHKHGGEIL